MRIATYNYNGHHKVGVLEDGIVTETSWSLSEVLTLMAARRDDEIATTRGASTDIKDVTLTAPLGPGSRIFCIGLNYAAHRAESDTVWTAPSVPVVFLKIEASIAGPRSDLLLDAAASTEFDWEAELGVVIGGPARNIESHDAWNVVAGYTAVNDVTARDRQAAHSQWCLGKNVEGSTPIGPCVTSIQELGAEPDLDLRLSVNGVEKQHARTSDMIFDIPTLISTISSVTTLLPGDIIATGTPSGVGFTRTPPEFLRDGDVVEVSIAGVGSLTNRVTIR